MDLVYEHLPVGNYTRLLQVCTVGPLNKDYECSFHIANLDAVADRTQTPEYTAISYCWGDAAPTSRFKFANGQSLPVSQTLRDLLDSLKIQNWEGSGWPLARFETTLWIDAICINQADTSERETQVDLMGKIYSSAQRVLAWLGASTPDSRRAFHIHDREDFHRTAATAEYPAALDSVLTLFERPWFSRTWVIQEMTLNRNVWVACGADIKPLEWLNEAADFCSGAEIKHFLPFAASERFYGTKILGFIGRNNFSTMYWTRKAFWGDVVGHDTSIISTEGLRWDMILMIAVNFKASDFRDKVYAFRGIVEPQPGMSKPDYDPPCPQTHRHIPANPDLRTDHLAIEAYRKAVDRVSTDTVRAVLCDGRSLDLLGLVGELCGSSREGLPTWALDLAQDYLHRPDRHVLLLHWAQVRGWNAGGPLVRATTPVPGAVHMIRLLARGFDVVDTVCPPFFETNGDTSVASQKKAMDAMTALRGEYFGTMGDDEWENMLCDALVLGLIIHNSRRWGPDMASEQLRPYFDAWVASLRRSTNTSEDYRAADLKDKFYQEMLAQHPFGWRAFATRGGLLGMGPSGTRVGDLVFLVPGCLVPLLFRPKQANGWEEETVPCMRLQSWCYVYGAMFGEKESWGFKEWELDVE